VSNFQGRVQRKGKGKGGAWRREGDALSFEKKIRGGGGKKLSFQKRDGLENAPTVNRKKRGPFPPAKELKGGQRVLPGREKLPHLTTGEEKQSLALNLSHPPL